MADSSNIGRNFILTGVVLGLGAAAMGAYISSNYEKQSISVHMPSSGKLASLTEKATQTHQEAKRARQVVDLAPADTWVPKNKIVDAAGKASKNPDGKLPRYMPLFFAPKLWQVAMESRYEVMDLLDPHAAKLHANVPNEKFFFYGMQDVLCDADALTQDTDGDGFSNGEELALGTDPSDASSMPPFVVGGQVKMVWVDQKVSTHTLELSSLFAITGDININVYDGKGANRNPVRLLQHKELKEGDTFGLGSASKGNMAKTRFKVLSKNEDETGKYIEVEDTYTAQEGAKVFKLRPGSKPELMHALDDVTVTFRMTAGSQKDKNVSGSVQPGQTFEVPGFKGTMCTLVKSAKRDMRVDVGDDKNIKVEKFVPPAAADQTPQTPSKP